MASIDNVAEKHSGKKIFLNHLDTYQGKNIGRYLSRCIVGASLEAAEEDEETKSVSIHVEGKRRNGNVYEIVGTMKSKEKQKTDFAKEIIQTDNKDHLYEYLVECDIIIYDITEDPDQIDEAVWAISELHSNVDKLEKMKTFILISTCMTWAKSKSLDPEEPDIPFTEEDYRKRKPHPNFKEHISAEKTVIKLGKTSKAKLLTYVVCSGLTYGAEENIFHYLFKSAWHNAPYLQCFGDGKNILPTIHIRDLAAVVQNVADARPKVRYIIAKDDSNNTQEDIVKLQTSGMETFEFLYSRLKPSLATPEMAKYLQLTGPASITEKAISNSLGSTKVKYMTKEETLLHQDIEQADFDMLLVNLRMDSVFVKESMHINWMSETGIVENIQSLIKEFKTSRSLQPLRAVILGPPAVGKSTISKQLCDFYKLHHIVIQEVIDEGLKSLKSRMRQFHEDHIGEEEAEAEEEELGDSGAKQAEELLNQILESQENNNGRIDDRFVIGFLRDRLRSMPCQNQGFILDGFPKTVSQTKELFAAGGEGDDESSDDANKFDSNIIPEFIVCLEAPDDFLKSRVMNLPEAVVANTHNTEKGLLRRLQEYRSQNTDDDSVLSYFDELEFLPEKIDVTKDKSEMMKDTVEKIKKTFGGTRNYGPTAKELVEIRKLETEAKIKKEAQEKAEKEKLDAEELYEKKRRQEEWSQRLTEVKREEFELLEAQSIPLRNYLMRHVMPTLTQGLIDCCKSRPEDPIDYLAEYLFQHNPQID